MDIRTEKIELAKLLLDTEDSRILRRIRAVFSDVDFNYDELPDYVKQGIERGLKDAEEGRVRDHKDVMREFKLKYGTDSSH